MLSMDEMRNVVLMCQVQNMGEWNWVRPTMHLLEVICVNGTIL